MVLTENYGSKSNNEIREKIADIFYVHRHIVTIRFLLNKNYSKSSKSIQESISVN